MLLKKLTDNKVSFKEKRQARKVIVLLFFLVLASVGLATGWREAPNIWKKITGPKTVVSNRFPFSPPTATPTPKFEKKKTAVEELLKPLRGEYGVFFQDLESGDSFSVNGSVKFSSASINKLPVLLTLYREAEKGVLDLGAEYKLQVGDKRGGAGSLQYKAVGYVTGYRGMAELMGKQSDNTAFNILSRILGGDKIQAVIDSLGMKNTSFADWETTPEDIGLYFRKLYREKIVSDKARDEILSFLTDTIWEDRIPAGLPKGVKVTHKIGTDVGVISDAGIVFAEKPFILVIMSQGANEIEANRALPEITRKIYELTNDND